MSRFIHVNMQLVLNAHNKAQLRADVFLLSMWINYLDGWSSCKYPNLQKMLGISNGSLHSILFYFFCISNTDMLNLKLFHTWPQDLTKFWSKHIVMVLFSLSSISATVMRYLKKFRTKLFWTFINGLLTALLGALATWRCFLKANKISSDCINNIKK